MTASTLALAGLATATGIAAALAVSTAPGQTPNQPACRLPTGPPSTGTSGPTGTDGPTGTSGPPQGAPPPGSVGTVQTGPPGGSGAPTPPTSTGSAPGGGPGMTNQATGNCPPGPTASVADKAQVYGKYCKAQSRKRTGSESPYTKCLTAMARVTLSALKLGATTTPAKACKPEPRRRIGRQRRTPYAMCVAGARKLATLLRRAVPQ